MTIIHIILSLHNGILTLLTYFTASSLTTVVAFKLPAKEFLDFPGGYGKEKALNQKPAEHDSETSSDRVDDSPQVQDGPEVTVTFQDPCRLGRHMGIYDAPRTILEAMPGVTLADMPRSRARAICCGVGNWMNCTSFTKQLQATRLKEAAGTGASVLVTACPKCEIHFTCALNDSILKDEVGLEITDLMALAASRLG